MGFFDADNSLVLQDDVNHKLLWVEFSSNGEILSAAYAELNDVGPLLYGESDAASPWAWAAVPLTAGGILAWAGHDSGNDSDKGIGETNEGPSAPESVVIGNGDEWITADEIDADGKVDVKIDLPADAVAGDRVIVNGEETVLTADDIDAGEIIVKVDAPNEGETLEVDVIIKDKDGNESDPTQAEATVDTTAPSAPDSVIIGNGDEWISADEIDADGKVDVKIDLPADAVAGDSVIVNGEETVLTADDITAGEIIVKVDSPSEGETLEVEVSIKDAAGNESDEILAEAAVDTTAPSAPTLVEIGNGDDTITAGEVAAGEVEVKVGLPATGIAVGDIVVVNGVEHILTQDDLDAEEVIIKVPMDAAENEEFTATATIKDAAGNESTPLADSAVVDVLVLGNDSSNAVYQESQVNPDPIGELTSDTAIKLLAGSSATDKLEFSIANGAQDVVITVKSESLVTVADAYSFTVINKETGQEYTVAASSTAQGGLVAGALGLEALGVIGDDGNGLRLDIHDLPPGDYEVVVQGDQSKLADILSTVSLEDLGSNTVETLILDTVTGLLKDALIGNENIAAGLLNQLSVEQLLNLVEGNPNPLVSGLGSTLQAVLANPLLALVLGDITSATVGEILEGDIDTGVLGLW